jgi:hypothetical protein
MNNITGRPDHIEDYLVKLHTGQWFGWSDAKNKVYANLIIHPKIWDVSYEGNIHEEGMIDNPHSKPSESDCTTGLATLQSNFDTAKTTEATKKASGKQKLLDLGLSEEEVKALIGV